MNRYILTINESLEILSMNICPWSIKVIEEHKRQVKNGAKIVRVSDLREIFDKVCYEFFDKNMNLLNIKIF